MTMNIERYVFTALINSNVYPQVRYQHYNREVYYTKRHENVKRGRMEMGLSPLEEYV